MTTPLDRIMQLEIVLPSQHFARCQKAPELRLMIAVLQDALDCVEKNRAAGDAQSRQLYFDAAQWFLAEELDWPYSFEGICGVLDLDSNAVRERLGMASVKPICHGAQ